MTTGNSSWRETGNTDFQSFRAAVRRSWTVGESPLATTAVAQAMFDALFPSGLTRLAAAQAWMETKNGSWNCSTAPPGFPCIPAINKNPFAMKSPAGGWRLYDSYVEAAREWADRILDPAGPYARSKTLAEYIAIYAPPNADGGNDQITYISTVCKEIDALPLVTQEKPMPPNPYPAPVQFDLAADYRRYGLTRTQTSKILQNRFENRQGYSIRALVCHIQEGTSAGSLQYWADTPGVQASSTVMIQKDGSVLSIIPPQHGPWTNGDVQKPSAKGQALIDRIGGANPNLATLSIEAEGYSGDTPPEAQVTAICWQLTEWMNRYGLGVADIYKHSDINSVTRANCPGTYWDVVMARLGGKPPAKDWPGKPDWLDPDLIPLLFPEATPGGIRTTSWLDWCDEHGLAPARKAFVFQGTDKELILFEGGLQIDKAGNWMGHA